MEKLTTDLPMLVLSRRTGNTQSETGFSMTALKRRGINCPKRGLSKKRVVGGNRLKKQAQVGEGGETVTQEM